MAIPLYCSRSEIFKEFSSEEQKHFFNLTRSKFLGEIDNYYYTVFLDEIHCASAINKLIEDLEELAENFDITSQDKIDFYGLDFYPFGQKGYNFRLSLPECFDVLIRSTLPNDKTPRIWIHVRSRFIWLFGPKHCLKTSYSLFKRILDAYEIDDLSVQENRIDYAFHNNAIQSPEKFFDRPKLKKHCKTKSRIYNLVGNPQNNWSLDYCSVGSRNSKSVFFRIYNKSREVIELNYKSFFIDIWFKNGLINEYDKFCLEYAFNLKSYDVGILCGQLQWYIKYGKDIKKKEKFEELFNKYFAENINTAKLRGNTRKYLELLISYNDINYIRRKVVNILPPVTVITNIEFETHRDFYRSFNKSLLRISKKSDDKLARLYLIYDCRKSFIKYLTSYGNTISFVKDNKVRLKDFTNDMYLSFWKKLRSTDLNTNYNPDLHREYERNIDIERAKRKVLSDTAVLSIYNNNGPNEFDSTTDFISLIDMLAGRDTLNDNDMHNHLIVNGSTGELAKIKYGDYSTIKKRKNRQLRSLFSSSGQDDENN